MCLPKLMQTLLLELMLGPPGLLHLLIPSCSLSYLPAARSLVLNRTRSWEEAVRGLLSARAALARCAYRTASRATCE